MLTRAHFAGIPLLLAALAPLAVGGASAVLRPPAASNSGTSIGVLGAVARPGVYRLAASSPDLSELIQRAGGLAPHANGNVRIVRNGKPGQQVFLTPSLRFPLQTGDVIVLDGAPPRRSPIQQANHSLPRGLRDPQVVTADLPPAQLALVNVLDRPVYLLVRGEHATVEQLVKLLGQAPEVAETVRIVPAGSVVPRAPLTKSSQLPSGTVLVFNRKVLDLQRIPPLPPLHEAQEIIPAESTEQGPVQTADAPEAMEFRRSSPSMAREEGATESRPEPASPSLGFSSLVPDGGSSRMLQLAQGSPAEPPSRTANTLSEPRLPPSKMEMLPPPPAVAQEPPRSGGVEMLPAPSDVGPGLQAMQPPVEAQREIVGYSEPISPQDPRNPAHGSPGVPFHTADASMPHGGMASAGPRDLAAWRAEQSFSGVTKVGVSEPLGPRSPSATLVSSDEAKDDRFSNLEVASIWGLFGAFALIAAWRSARKKMARPGAASGEMEPARAHAIAEDHHSTSQPATRSLGSRVRKAIAATAGAAPAASATRLQSRLDALIANEIPVDVRQVEMASPIEVFGRPRRASQHRIDEAHAETVSAPHFSTQAAASAATAMERVAMDRVAMERAPAVPAASAVSSGPTVPAGHRVDEAHGEGKSASGHVPARPHIAERKGDVLERVLTSVEGAARHIAAPHISGAMAASEAGALEDTAQP